MTVVLVMKHKTILIHLNKKKQSNSNKVLPSRKKPTSLNPNHADTYLIQIASRTSHPLPSPHFSPNPNSSNYHHQRKITEIVSSNPLIVLVIQE